MIRAEVTENGVAFVGDLASGWFAYVDADWLPECSHPVAWIGVGPDGALAWCDGPPALALSSIEPDTAAALVLLAVSGEVAAVVEDLPPASVEITGHGLVARLVRARLGHATRDERQLPGADRPRAIVETTGDPVAIVDASRRIEDLGTVVLVGEILGRKTEMNLYPDVHARGLTLVGIAPPLRAGFVVPETHPEDPLVAACREYLVGVAFGVPVPSAAAWYRLSG